MYCFKCGTELPASAQFCLTCGQPIGAAWLQTGLSAAAETTIGTFRQSAKKEMTLTSRRIKWSDGSELGLENLRDDISIDQDEGAWLLRMYRRSDGGNEGTGFEDRQEGNRAMTAVMDALRRFSQAHPTAGPAIEFKEITVILDIEGKAAAGHGIDQSYALRQAAINAGGFANQKITAALQQEGAAGWYPEGPTDLIGALLVGQVSWKQSGGFLMSWKFRFNWMDIRMSRRTR